MSVQAAQARERVQQQIDATPDNTVLDNLLGSLLFQENEADNSEQAFKKSLELNDQLQVSYMNLAELYRRTKRTQEVYPDQKENSR